MSRKFFPLILVVLSAFMFAKVSYAAPYIEGKDYQRMDVPVSVKKKKKIEVLEAFWYGCPHCYDFHNNHLPAWKKSMAADVDFDYVPATFPRIPGAHIEAFYVAKALKIVDKMQTPLFDAIQTNMSKYSTRDAIRQLFIENGVSEEKFESAYKKGGFRKISKVEEGKAKAQKIFEQYGIDGVPMLIVNGKYKITVGMAKNFANMVKIANYLIEKERALLNP